MTKMKDKVRREVIRESDTFREFVIFYHETVEACHDTIKALADELMAVRSRAESEIEMAADLQREVDDLEAELADSKAEADDHAIASINDLLDECERVGVLRYTVPQTDRASRAIVALHNIAGRNP